ncbi:MULTISPECIES: citrulline utilization hydrolase CtlX [Burkholderia]|uniref:Amidinotransferase n=2 Tax=Burkholderia cenocepacia TaxID=95486 RepID=A0A9Q5MA88_9BURK|nr:MULTISPECIES: arginine deiminase-related protein [Burkholderia]ALV58907.1 amidinotransferase [Burkholderia cenocepacia]AMU11892.1 amidinotransferase [Burkholderia cenocepacia]AQQ45756.1 amidinotransferase [Burkholderia cenocepacia]ARF87406.1 amidinotransferase family protein [Burkholderia cenocepacia]KVF51373.1 amidinotransferase [Burkholderia cenocepacia]
MNLVSIQAPSAVVMIRPHRFLPNPQTAADNAFQCTAAGGACDTSSISAAARDEVTAAARTLADAGVRVHVFDDHGERDTPDSVFPNNWFSTHPGGHVALYPMHSPNRRRERRADVIEMLKAEYRVQDVIDYSGLEYDDVFLEGTGAMALDHVARIAYTARSRRADPVALERFCTHFNFEPICFDTADANGKPIYHTNVMMSVATEFAMVGLDLIADSRRRGEIAQRLSETGRAVIALDASQIANFAGNTLELSGKDGRVLALSRRAFDCLTHDQRAVIERSARLLPLDVPTIELAGGSVRCMLAGIHLARRSMAARDGAAIESMGREREAVSHA